MELSKVSELEPKEPNSASASKSPPKPPPKSKSPPKPPPKSPPKPPESHQKFFGPPPPPNHDQQCPNHDQHWELFRKLLGIPKTISRGKYIDFNW